MVFFGRREETKSLPCAYVPVVTVENSSPLGTHALFLIIRLPAINHDAYLQVRDNINLDQPSFSHQFKNLSRYPGEPGFLEVSSKSIDE